jgi:hypothetical protein
MRFYTKVHEAYCGIDLVVLKNSGGFSSLPVVTPLPL